METTKQLKLGKKGGIIAVIIVLLAAIGVIYARQQGVNLHIKTSTIKSSNYTAKEYLDGQVEIEGTITMLPPEQAGDYMVFQTDGTIIDISKAYQSPNAKQFIRGDITLNAHFKGVVMKADKEYNYPGATTAYELWPSSPYYLEITP